MDPPLSKFLYDAQPPAFMTDTKNLPYRLVRLIVTALTRTGMLGGELLGLAVDAVVQIGAGYAPPSASCTPISTSHCTLNSKSYSTRGSPPGPTGKHPA